MAFWNQKWHRILEQSANTYKSLKDFGINHILWINDLAFAEVRVKRKIRSKKVSREMISGKTMHIFIYFEQNEKYTSNLEHPSQKTTHQIRDYKNLSSDRNNFTKNKSISNDFGVEEAVNIQTCLKTLILTLLKN